MCYENSSPFHLSISKSGENTNNFDLKVYSCLKQRWRPKCWCGDFPVLKFEGLQQLLLLGNSYGDIHTIGYVISNCCDYFTIL